MNPARRLWHWLLDELRFIASRYLGTGEFRLVRRDGILYIEPRAKGE